MITDNSADFNRRHQCNEIRGGSYRNLESSKLIQNLNLIFEMDYILFVSKNGGIMQDKLIVFVVKLALLNRLLGADKITMREYIAVKSNLMRKYNVL